MLVFSCSPAYHGLGGSFSVFRHAKGGCGGNDGSVPIGCGGRASYVISWGGGLLGANTWGVSVLCETGFVCAVPTSFSLPRVVNSLAFFGSVGLGPGKVRPGMAGEMGVFVGCVAASSRLPPPVFLSGGGSGADRAVDV